MFGPFLINTDMNEFVGETAGTYTRQVFFNFLEVRLFKFGSQQLLPFACVVISEVDHHYDREADILPSFKWLRRRLVDAVRAFFDGAGCSSSSFSFPFSLDFSSGSSFSSSFSVLAADPNRLIVCFRRKITKYMYPFFSLRKPVPSLRLY